MSKEEINAFLGSGTHYEGKLRFQGAVRIDGSFTGEIESEGALIIGKDATIKANIKVGEFILAGNFLGDATVKSRMVMHKTSIFQGSLHTPNLSMEEGAQLDGRIYMATPPTATNNADEHTVPAVDEPSQQTTATE